MLWLSGLCRNCMVEGRLLYELKVIHVLSVLGPIGRVGIFL